MKKIIRPLLICLSVLAAACTIDPGETGNKNKNTGSDKPDEFFTLGGTVTGLVGKRLRLRINDGNDLVVGGKGAFFFPDPLKNFTKYTIKIIKQPDNPVQQCNVVNGEGTVSGIDISNIVVECDFVWSQAGDLSDNISPDGSDAITPKVAMDAKGDAIVVWQQDVGGISQIFMSEYRSGIWKHPVDLSDSISLKDQNAFFPQVAMSDIGDAIVTWYQLKNGFGYVFKSELKNGQWTHPKNYEERINILNPTAITVAFEMNPDVAMNTGGDAIIAWTQPVGDFRAVFKAEYRKVDPDNEVRSWLLPELLSDRISLNGTSADGSKVAISDSTNYESIVAWRQSDGSAKQVYFSERRLGEWKPATKAFEDKFNVKSTEAGPPQVAMNYRGHTVIAWHQKDKVEQGINQIYRTQYFNESGPLSAMKWFPPEDLKDKVSLDGTDSVNPKVSVDDYDRAVIVWHTTGTRQDIFQSEFSNVDKIVWPKIERPSQRINLADSSAFSPTVAGAKNSSAVIMWRQKAGVSSQVFKRQYSSALKRWRGPENILDHISLGEKGTTGEISVAMSEQGDALAAWMQSDGNNFQIFYSEYRTTGSELEYSVGGTVSGYTGSGLTLQNNGVDTLKINNDGEFKFKNSLRVGESYDVKIHEQPAGNSQTCGLENESGTASDADIVNIRVKCISNSLPMKAIKVNEFNTLENKNFVGAVPYNEKLILLDAQQAQILQLDSDNNLAAIISQVSGFGDRVAMQIVNNDLYFLTAKSSPPALYKIDLQTEGFPLDFSEISSFASNESWIVPASLTINSEGQIYIISPASNSGDGYISVLNQDGSEADNKLTYTENALSDLTSDGENIYLTEKSSIVKLNASNLRNTLDFGYTQLSLIHYTNNKLYFVDENSIYQYDNASHQTLKLYEIPKDTTSNAYSRIISIFTDNNDNLFYLTSNALWQLVANVE